MTLKPTNSCAGCLYADENGQASTCFVAATLGLLRSGCSEYTPKTPTDPASTPHNATTDGGALSLHPKTPPKANQTAKRAEADLQAECVAILEARGYRLLTGANLDDWRNGLVRGWYGHLVNCERNPIMPDLWIDELRGRLPTLRVELKARPVYQSGQKSAILLGYWHVCFEVAGFEMLLDAWEAG